jgi:pyruvate dehydrogenase E2 component (dihydrolipoamide acetyltransferase)
MSPQAVLVPDIGSDSADVIEILVKPGDAVTVEQSIIVLESDKASMEVPCPSSGVIGEIAAKIGQSVKQGDVLLYIEALVSATKEMPVQGAEIKGAPIQNAAPEIPVKEIQAELEHVSTVLAPSMNTASVKTPKSKTLYLIKTPDIGSEAADVIDLLVKAGDVIALEQSILVLESAKASMEVPSTVAGVVQKILVKIGDKVSEGVALLEVLAEADATAASTQMLAVLAEPERASLQTASALSSGAASPAVAHVVAEVSNGVAGVSNSAQVHAGPAVRKLARELGVDLAKIAGTGPRERILKENVHAFVKQAMTAKPMATGSSAELSAVPVIDFAKWGEVERIELTKIQKLSAKNLHRAWVTIPHVTQFDEADITELEAFRVAQKESFKAEGLSLTLLSFLVKASAHLLRQFPKFSSSLEINGEYLVQKKYIHIGVAVDTPNGLVVPVIRDADKKSIREIAKDLDGLSAKARDKKLTPADMQGACFSISSLGGIGGTAFTPIVNWPEVAILGVSRSAIKPVWDGKIFQPRLILPLSLSYDHRVIDGADGARFTTALATVLADIKQVLL